MTTTIENNLVVIDFETSEHLSNGAQVASTAAYKLEFRVDSAAITYHSGDRLHSSFIQGETVIRDMLEQLAQRECKIVAHNIQFEMLVVACRFPELYQRLNWYADTMRLAQVYDNGGDETSYEVVVDNEDLLDLEDMAEMLAVMGEQVRRESTSGLGLVKCLKRIFKHEYQDHKKEAYTWLRAQGIKEGKEGANLHLLPLDILERYNVADTENTYKLYDHCVNYFKSIGYRWEFDHELFLSTVRLFVGAKLDGIRVDRESLFKYVESVRQEIEDIGQSFLKAHAGPISQVEADRLAAWCSEPKTDKGREKRRQICTPGSPKWDENVRFNPGSNKQLQTMFMDKMGMRPKFFTEKGNPSFKSSVLDQWGDGGVLLQKRRKRLIVLKQCEALLSLSEYDGKWRPDVRAAGTATGRAAGGNG